MSPELPSADARPLPDCRQGPPLGPVRLTVPSDPRHLRLVRDVVARLGQCVGFAEETRFQLQLAVDEALTNVIRHAYGDRHDQPIDLTLEPVESPRHGLQIVVRDFGRAVDPATIKSRDLDDFRPGGLGVHIIRSLMDEVEYTAVPEGGMRLRLLKFV